MKIHAPEIRNIEARERFRATAKRMSLDPDNLWVGGYVDHEWNNGRHVLECAGLDVRGLEVLEFGCNIGATSIILAAMGARVTAVDVDPDCVALAGLNSAAYGFEKQIDIVHVPDTSQLPFASGQFDLVTCNSVLEYVSPGARKRVQREIDRVLKPGGVLLVSATSNRMWPREVHSRQWFINYVPRLLDVIFRKQRQRGVSPFRVRYGFGPWYQDLALAGGKSYYLEAKRRMGMGPFKIMLLRGAACLLSPLRVSPGLLTPSICLLLRKQKDAVP